MKLPLLFTVAAAFAATTLVAQNSEQRHLVGGSVVIDDYSAPLNNQYFDFNQKQFTGLEFFYGLRLGSSFNLEIPVGFGATAYPTRIADKTVKASKNSTYASLSPRLVYKFNNGYFLKENAAIAPYIFGGIGAIAGIPANNNLDAFVPFGAGLRFPITETASLSLEGDYRKSLLTKTDNFLLKFGAIFAAGKEKDTDNDGISDKMDKCPDVAGLKQFEGCPDTDGDGITDAADTCPKDKGLPAMNGCPDTDGDGIVDKDDACPADKGSAALGGCPDKDEDGIADKDDKCPDVKGLAGMQGCPDTDGDGITDAADKCPRKAGVAALQGCPDADGDGVTDADDLCPDVKGLAAFNGCPDTDEDGIADADDKCPKEKGVPANQGCPAVAAPVANVPAPVVEKDTDGDGVMDKSDKCPTEAGSKENFGCSLKKEVTFSFDNILFETGKATLKPQSFPVLDQVVVILTQNPKHLAAVMGHTDSQGKPDANQKLSQARAKTCLDYIVSKGIAASRLNSIGLGDTVPIADNKTPEGRAMNRRVEFKLSLPK
jgi:OmpA-OmpF porin, OOP family